MFVIAGARLFSLHSFDPKNEKREDEKSKEIVLLPETMSLYGIRCYSTHQPRKHRTQFQTGL